MTRGLGKQLQRKMERRCYFKTSAADISERLQAAKRKDLRNQQSMSQLQDAFDLQPSSPQIKEETAEVMEVIKAFPYKKRQKGRKRSHRQSAEAN